MLEGYSIRDEKSGTFTPPFFVKHVVMATRSVEQAANDPQSNLSKYPEDFSLWRLCEFDEDTGDVEQLSPPTKILGLTALIKKGQQNAPA